jgi:exopolysaccharide biosynthesis polyprenyl glycosylphosphotransferase
MTRVLRAEPACAEPVRAPKRAGDDAEERGRAMHVAAQSPDPALSPDAELSTPRRRRTDHIGSTEAPVPPEPVQGARPWQTSYVVNLVVLDIVAITLAMLTAYAVRFGVEERLEEIGGVPFLTLAALLAGAWLLMLSSCDCYEPRQLGIGSDEFKGVVVATFRVFGAIAIASYVFKAEIARGYVAVAMPVGLLLLLLFRFGMRRWIQHQRRRGLLQHRVVVIGDRRRVAELVAQFRLEPNAGFTVVGACLPDANERMRDADHVTVLGDIASVVDVVRQVGADTVAISASPDVRSEDVRRISWDLEGEGVDIIVAPAVTDVAGPRVTVRPVAGLPLLHVEEPEFTGVRRVVKTTIDRVGAALGLLLVSPLLLVAIVAIKIDSKGPAFFRQHRVGRAGQAFDCLKLRTMHVDAEARLHELVEHNKGDGLLFKIDDDPRITRVGRFLRRSSIDELPQLWNVVRGDMSLVGPRPLAVKDEEFEGDVRRRLLVRPGITGLWQVSGRTEQSWEDAVRLDLYYVENWSIALDFVILARTVLHVLRGSGS